MKLTHVFTSFAVAIGFIGLGSLLIPDKTREKELLARSERADELERTVNRLLAEKRRAEEDWHREREIYKRWIGRLGTPLDEILDGARGRAVQGEHRSTAELDRLGFHASVALEDDGWHIDYFYMNVCSDSGPARGPSYTFDPASGELKLAIAYESQAKEHERKAVKASERERFVRDQLARPRRLDDCGYNFGREFVVPSPEDLASLSQFHREMQRKYDEAARSKSLLVRPDPPEPEVRRWFKLGSAGTLREMTPNEVISLEQGFERKLWADEE